MQHAAACGIVASLADEAAAEAAAAAAEDEDSAGQDVVQEWRAAGGYGGQDAFMVGDSDGNLQQQQ